MGRFSKIKNIKFGKYFRELSIVIIGVAVTLAASSIISSIQERKNLKLQVNAIYSELEDNRQRIQTLAEFYKDTEKMQNLLLEDYRYPGSVHKDSISKLYHIISRSAPFIYKRNAYGMFINSGGMKDFNNKKILLDITECYALIQTLKESYDLYMDLKVDVFKNLLTLETELLVDQMDIKAIPTLYNFHLMNTGDTKTPPQIKALIEKILSTKK